MKNRVKTVLLLLAIFILGIIFRLWIASLAPQPFINDQKDYEWFATKILRDPHMLASHTFRTYPTPLLNAIIYRFAGFGNHTAIFFVQAVLDSFVSLMIFYILRRGLKFRNIAWLGAVLYAVNPFTAGYVNVVLSEILSIWTVAATVLSGIFFIRRPTIFRGALFGLILGVGAETRNAAFFWAIIPLGLLLWVVPFQKAKWAFGAVMLGLVLAVLYPLTANWRDYKVINISTVDDFYAKELFNGAIIKRLPPLAPPLPQATYQMYAEYYSEYWPERQNSAYRKAIAIKYYMKAWNVIAGDPLSYIKTCFGKMWYVWQKEAIYVYVEPGYESHRIYTYMANLFVLAFALTGLLFFPVRKGQKGVIARWVRWTIIGTILYGTLAFSITHAEYRLTIPFYPLLFISASAGFGWVAHLVQKIFRKESLQ